MLHLYYGPDTFSKAEAIARLKLQLDTDGMLGVNTVSLDGTRISLAEVEAVCDTVPFLSSQRLVIITDLLARPPPRAQRGRSGGRTAAASQPEDGADGFIQYIGRLPASTTLLLLEGSLRGDNPVVRVLRPLGEVRDFPILDEQDTATWIDRRVRALGAAFEPQAVRLLASLTRGDLWTAASEVEKLSLYVAGRAEGRIVTEADVRRLVAAAEEGNIFAMADAVAEGRAEDALRGLELQLQNGAAGPYLLAMIARQFRQLLIVQDMTARGASQKDTMQAAEIRSDGALRRITRQTRGWSASRLLAAYERILEADLAIKRGEAGESVALELLIGDLGGLSAFTAPRS